jgi:hypothetical protein
LELLRAVFSDVDFRSLLKRAAWRFQAEFLHEQIAEPARNGVHRALFKGFQSVCCLGAAAAGHTSCTGKNCPMADLGMVQSRCKQARLSCLHVR